MAITTVITGRMTKDPELRTVKCDGQDTHVIDFYLACDDGFKTNDKGEKENTEFFRVTAWRGAADAIAKWGTKGRTLTVTGASHLRSFNKDGRVTYYMAIPRPWYFEFIGSSGKTEAVVPNDAPANAPETVPSNPWDELENP